MQTVLGPFHPDLENALVDAISQHKQADLLRPLLILVPSDLIRRRLKILLSPRTRLGAAQCPAADLSPIVVAPEWRMRQPRRRSCIATCFSKKRCVKLSAPASPVPSPLPASKIAPAAAPRCGRPCATCATAWSIRQLALAALGEGHFTERTGERTAQLLALLQTLQTFCDEQDIKDLADLDRRATEQAPSSPFLQQFNEIFYYGFYDLTQIQLDFFRAVASHYPTTLFFPLLTAIPGHDAWSFAARFYERYVQGHADGIGRRFRIA